MTIDKESIGGACLAFFQALQTGEHRDADSYAALILASVVTDLRRIADTQKKIAEEMERVSISAVGASEEYFRQNRGG